MSAIPPMPPKLAQDLVEAVAQHVRFDPGPLRAVLIARLADVQNEHDSLPMYVWPRSEWIAGDVIDAEWPDELVEQCEQALAQAHEDFLVRAASCLEVARDLEAAGCESWIAGAIRHRLAFEASWEAIGERGREEWLSDEGREGGEGRSNGAPEQADRLL